MSDTNNNIVQQSIINSTNDTTSSEKNCAQCGKPGSKKCGNCRSETYCSVDCQRTHWQTHKLSCQSPPSSKPDSSNDTTTTQEPSGELKPEQTEAKPPTSPPAEVASVLRLQLRLIGQQQMYTMQLETSTKISTVIDTVSARLGMHSLRIRVWIEYKGQGTFTTISDGFGLVNNPELKLSEVGVIANDQKLLIDIRDHGGIWERDRQRAASEMPRTNSQFAHAGPDAEDDDDDDDDGPGYPRGNMRPGPGGPRGMDPEMLLNMLRSNDPRAAMFLNSPFFGSMMPSMRTKTREEMEEEELQKALALSLEEEQKRVAEAKKKDEEKKKIEAEQEQIKQFYDAVQTKATPKLTESIHEDFDDLEQDDLEEEFDEENAEEEDD